MEWEEQPVLMNERRNEMSEWTEFVGYDEDGTPIFVTVKGVPEAN